MNYKIQLFFVVTLFLVLLVHVAKSSGSECKDISRSCLWLKAKNKCNRNWVKQKCPKTCGVCVEECKDETTRCEYIKRKSLCNFKPEVAKLCPVSCGTCGGVSPTTTSPEATERPTETTMAPEKTTMAPEETTMAPEDTTKAPEETTTTPSVKTTKTPTETTTPSVKTTKTPTETTTIRTTRTTTFRPDCPDKHKKCVAYADRKMCNRKRMREMCKHSCKQC